MFVKLRRQLKTHRNANIHTIRVCKLWNNKLFAQTAHDSKYTHLHEDKYEFQSFVFSKNHHVCEIIIHENGVTSTDGFR